MKQSLLVIPLISMFGCAHLQSNKLNSEPKAVIIGIDTSGSARSFLGAYAAVTSQIATQLDIYNDEFTVFRFDSQTSEMYGPRPPINIEEFQMKLVHELKKESTNPGTILADFFQSAHNTILKSNKKCIVVCFFDGFIDDYDPKADKRLTETAKSIADNDKVIKLIIAGTTTGTREKLRTLLEPISHKLFFEELEDVVEQLLK